MFSKYIARWQLMPDGSPIVTGTSRAAGHSAGRARDAEPEAALQVAALAAAELRG